MYNLSLTGKRLSSPSFSEAWSLMSLRERDVRDFRPELPLASRSGVRRIGELMRPGADASSLPLSGGGGVSVLGGACSSEIRAG